MSSFIGSGRASGGTAAGGAVTGGTVTGGTVSAERRVRVRSGSRANGADGADDALTDLYTAHYRDLVRLAYLLLGDQCASEEAVQDAYLRVHASWGRLREPAAAQAYLRQAVLNVARVALRHAPSPFPDAASAEYGALGRLERQSVVVALRSLPLRQREALVLRYYADLSEAQIAAAMRISAGAVKSHTSRGMAALRLTLEQQ